MVDLYLTKSIIEMDHVYHLDCNLYYSRMRVGD